MKDIKLKKIRYVDYDKSKYNYETYWNGRDYENAADHMAVKALIKPLRGKWFIDIGGSYGRLLDTYENKFDNIILLDYSVNSLQKAQKRNEDKKNIYYIAANIYKLPFKDKSIDNGLMVRVIHHLIEAETALKEVGRVINKNFILEFANKRHFIALLRAMMRRNISFITDLSPHQQEYRDTSQGAKGKDQLKQIFLNYHPKYIYNISGIAGFKIKKVLSVSNFRNPILKRILPFKLMVALEMLSQKTLSFAQFGPSIYLLLSKTDEKKSVSKNIEDILICPECRGELIKGGNNLSCKKCDIDYPIIDGIFDLRRES